MDQVYIPGVSTSSSSSSSSGQSANQNSLTAWSIGGGVGGVVDDGGLREGYTHI